ncbi:MAG: cytochrome b/b6 domain-containing protein [Burkholderiaceae bacterium]|jgi:cytochrome b561|nr:cytochrome b/b6 domain-containing protein [Burkholderiaceae bacterium]
MSLANPTSPTSAAGRWTPSITVHWLSALAVMAAVALAMVHEWIDDETLGRSLLAIHRQIGLTVLLLLVVRLLLRLRPDRDTTAVDQLPMLMRWAAGLVHWVLYAFLLAMPLLGWAMTSAQGHKVRLFGAVPLPSLVSVNPDLADSFQEWHEWCAWGLLTVVAMHIAAALFHHFVRRDNVLASMWPPASHADE